MKTFAELIICVSVGLALVFTFIALTGGVFLGLILAVALSVLTAIIFKAQDKKD